MKNSEAVEKILADLWRLHLELPHTPFGVLIALIAGGDDLHDINNEEFSEYTRKLITAAQRRNELAVEALKA